MIPPLIKERTLVGKVYTMPCEYYLQYQPKRQVQSQLPQQPSDAPNRPNLKIRLAKDTSGEWSTAGSHVDAGLVQPGVSAVNVVGSFLQGIRASFRHDNVVSGQEIHSKKSNENGK